MIFGKMKITFVMDGGDNLSGGHRAIAMYARGLLRLGHDVSLFARPLRPRTLRDRARSLLRGDSSVPAPPHSHFAGIGAPLQILDRWRPVQDSDLPDADAVVATWWETVEWVSQLAASKGVKVQLMQDYEIWGGPQERVDRSCESALAKIVTAEWLGDLLRERFHQTPLAVVRLGVDTAAFDAPPRSKQAVPTVGFTYSGMHHKGSDISIRAVQIARKRIPNLRLLACGSTEIWPEHPLPENTRYELSASDDTMRGLYSQCDAWLFGSRREGFGLPILEAMACRTPVIGTPAGAAPKLLHGGAGVLVKPEDPADMARAIVHVCGLSNTEWQKVSDAAHARVAEYSWNQGCLELEAALKEAIESSSRARVPA